MENEKKLEELTEAYRKMLEDQHSAWKAWEKACQRVARESGGAWESWAREQSEFERKRWSYLAQKAYKAWQDMEGERLFPQN